MKTKRGAMLFAVGLLFMVMFLVPQVVIAITMRDQRDPAAARQLIPLGLLSYCLYMLLFGPGRAVHFTPAETQWLFPAPFTRRQIMLYRMMTQAVAAIPSALFISLFTMRHTMHWGASVTGIYLTLLFVQLFSTCVLFVSQTAATAAFTRGRQIVLIVVAAAVASLLYYAVQQQDAPAGGFIERLKLLSETPGGRIVLRPFGVFASAITASSLVELLPWAAIALAINAALAVAVLALDANYIEASVKRAQWMHQRMQQARRGTIAATGGRAARWRLPMPPDWRGAGPIAWQQATHSMRTSRMLIPAMLMLAIVAVLMARGEIAKTPQPVAIIAGGMVYVTFLLTAMLPMGFRCQLDVMGQLKTLPIAPLPMVLGNLLPPLALITGAQWLMIGGLCAMLPRLADMLIALAAALVPVNVIFLAVENAAFLLYPVRPAATPGDFQVFGKQMLIFMVKAAVYFVIGGVTATFVVGVWFITNNPAATMLTGLTIVIATAVALLIPLVIAYNRFDPAQHTPPA